MNAELVLLLAKLDGLRYPAGQAYGIGGVYLYSFPAEYINDLLAVRQKMLEMTVKDTDNGR